MEHLLEDITVIDAATFLAGPGAGTIMADFGANVIKIEPPGGDGYRALVGRHPVPYHWLLTSRNKKSVGLDLTKDAGQKLIHELVAKADVFTTNFMQKQLKRYNLEYETLKAINPRLIYAHISGYGSEGPESDRRAFDVTGWWARTGHMDFVRDQGQVPLGMSPGMGDHCTAATFYGAIMTGLYRRERTGEGSFVSTSLAASGVWANGMALQGVVAGTDIAKYRQEKGWPNPLTDCYRCADDRFIVLAIINTAREYPQLMEALGQKALLVDDRFTDFGTAMKNREAFRDILTTAFVQFTFEQISERLESIGVTHSLVYQADEILADEQLRANGIIVETDDDGEGYELTIGSPINVLEAPKKPPKRAPELGADTLQVLRDLDFEESYIQELVSSDVVIAAESNE